MKCLLHNQDSCSNNSLIILIINVADVGVIRVGFAVPFEFNVRDSNVRFGRTLTVAVGRSVGSLFAFRLRALHLIDRTQLLLGCAGWLDGPRLCLRRRLLPFSHSHHFLGP